MKLFIPILALLLLALPAAACDPTIGVPLAAYGQAYGQAAPYYAAPAPVPVPLFTFTFAPAASYYVAPVPVPAFFPNVSYHQSPVAYTESFRVRFFGRRGFRHFGY